MKRKVYLHIGLPKTGTTYLQWQIQCNRDKLKSNDIYIPRTGQLIGPDQNLLALALQPERWHQFSDEVAMSLPSMWHDLVDEIEKSDCQNILVSCEALSWELKTLKQFKLIRDYLAGYDVRIVFCERNSYEFIASMYGHLIRTGRGPYPLESFLREFPYYWNTAFQKERWGRVFGKRKFLVLSYEDLKGETILLKFLEKLFPGHAIPSTSLEIAHDADSNLSYSPRFLRFMEELSANQVDSAPYARLYATVLNSIVPLERRMLSPTVIDEAMKRCGMELDSSGSAASNLAHQRGRKRQGAPNLEQVSNDLMERTREFIEARKTLIERSTLLERSNAELQERTKELMAIREVLAERTALLEETNADLVGRTADLVAAREALAERTARLERSVRDLLERTRDLVQTRELLVERTEILKQTQKQLEERTLELAQARKALAERTKTSDESKTAPQKRKRK